MENLFFALEVKINGAVGDAGRARDIGDLRIEVTVVSEDADRRAQNGRALVSDDGTNGW